MLILGRLLEKKLGLSHEQAFHLGSFLLLGAGLTAANILAHAIASSLFLSQVGPEHLPQFYLFLGLLSIPASLGLAWGIDRLPRVQLFRSLLLISLVGICWLRFLLSFGDPPVYYALLLSIQILDLLSNILFWTLLSDYFSPLELEHHTPFLSLAMTIGGMVGGSLVHLLVNSVGVENLLLVLPFLYGFAVVQLIRLQQTGRGLDISTSTQTGSLLASLKTLPQLFRYYPIVALLAVSMLLSVMVWSLSELQFSTIYARTFPNTEDLAALLGLLSACFSLLELLVTYFVTRPLIRYWGVNTLNLLYPLTTLLSFGLLTLSPHLPTAIVANFNYDTLSSSLATPVQNLNFTVLPRRFIGRVRILIDGVCYPGSQAITGFLLIYNPEILDPLVFSLSSLSISLLFLLVGYLTGKIYFQSMLTRLESGAVTLNQVREGLARLPSRYIPEVRQFLTSSDQKLQILGLELAARLEDPSQFLPDIQKLIHPCDPAVQAELIQFLGQSKHPNLIAYLRTHLTADEAYLRQLVLEALIIGQQPLSPVQLCFFLEDSEPTIRALACVAVQQLGSLNPTVQEHYQQVWKAGIAIPDRLIMIRGIQSTQNPNLVPLLHQLLDQAPAIVRVAGLEALSKLVTFHDRASAMRAVQDLTHADPAVRVAAFKVLAVVSHRQWLKEMAQGLADPVESVRAHCAIALATRGDSCLPLLTDFLQHPRPEVVAAARSVLGKLQSRRSEDLLFQQLKPQYQQACQSLQWQQHLPQGQPGWRPLEIALRDYQQELAQEFLAVLAELGHAPAIERIIPLFRSDQFAVQQTAIEILSTLTPRRFVQPVLSLLNALLLPPRLQPSSEQRQRLLQELLATQQPWLQVGALLALVAEQQPIPIHIPCSQPFVHLIQKQLASEPITTIENLPVNRLFFLKTVSLLQHLSLDDLLLLDQNLEQQEFLAGETIFQEGQLGQEFFILYRGQVTLLKKTKTAQRELTCLQEGDYFGEMALFDYLPRSATAIATTNCTLLCLGHTSFQTLITHRLEIMNQLCKELILRLRQTNDQLED